MNIIERAVKTKMRINTSIGQLSVEQLYDLPLNTRGQTMGLKDLARNVNANIKTEDDLFNESSINSVDRLRFDVLMHIINERQEESKASSDKKALESQLAQFTDILNNKKNEAIHSLSIEELEAKIAELKSK